MLVMRMRQARMWPGGGVGGNWNRVEDVGVGER